MLRGGHTVAPASANGISPTARHSSHHAQGAGKKTRRRPVVLQVMVMVVAVLVLGFVGFRTWGQVSVTGGPHLVALERPRGPTHVAAVVPLGASPLSPKHLVALLRENTVRLTMFYVVDSEASKAACQTAIAQIEDPHTRQALERYEPQILVPVALTRYTATFGGMIDFALSVIASRNEYTHMLWISQTHKPIVPGFVDGLVRPMQNDVGMVTCTTLLNSSSGRGHVILDKGYWVGDGEKQGTERYFIIRRFAGLPAHDERTFGSATVDAGTAHCTLVDLAATSQLGLRPEFGEAKLEAESRAMEVQRMKARIMRMARALSTISIADVNKGGDALRDTVRLAFHQMKKATVAWEEATGRRYIDSQSETLDPAITQEDHEIASRVATATVDVQLRFYYDHLEQSMTTVRKPRGADSIDAMAWDLSFKFERNGLRTVVAEVPALLDESVLPPEVRKKFTNGSIALRTSYPVYGQFLRQWSKTVQKLYKGNDDESEPLKIVWDGFCCGCCGFASEIAHFVYPMHKKRRIRITLAPSCFCSGYAATIADTLERLSVNVYRYPDNAPKNEVVIWISHTDPLGYANPILAQRKPDYFIGRSMYEFTKLPHGWTQAAGLVNELWVPGKWVRDMFTANGMDSKKMYIVPEGIDTWFFDPTKRLPFPLPLDQSRKAWRSYCNHPGNASNYKFFSNFKWEPRKGWDILFEAYTKAFKPSDPVSLYVLTYVFGRDLDIYNISMVKHQMTEFFSARLNITDKQVPHFCIFTELVTEDELADMYNSADAFVLPTRGEGWGLPTIQAMALAKPTISTAWGGQMEFMTQETTFMIDLDGMEEIPRDSIYGWDLGKKWATPSLDHTAELMKYVVTHREHAAAVGARARKHIVKHFSEEAVATLADRRLHEIRAWIKHLRRSGK